MMTPPVTRAMAWGLGPGEQRRKVYLTREELCALPLASIGSGYGPDSPSWLRRTQDRRKAPHGERFLVVDRFDWPNRCLLLVATVIEGPWRYGEQGAGDRLPCTDTDPRRWRPDTKAPHGTAERSTGYALVWSECPALDVLLARRETKRLARATAT